MKSNVSTEETLPTATLLSVGDQTFDGEQVRCAVVLQFDTAEDLRLAIAAGAARFAWSWDREPRPLLNTETLMSGRLNQEE